MQTPHDHGSDPMSMPRVLVVKNYRPDQQNSMIRYGDCLVEGLRVAGFDPDVIEVCEIAGRFAKDARLKRLFGLVDKYFIFPIFLRSAARKVDIVHIVDHSNSIYQMLVPDKIVLITCHDVFAIKMMLGINKQGAISRFGKILQKFNLRGLKRATHISCVSAATASDLRALAPNASIGVIPLSLSKKFLGAIENITDVSSVSKVPLGQFFLHVGSNTYYKNRPGVVLLFEKLNLHPEFTRHSLVLAGRSPDKKLASLINASRLRDRIVVLSDPSDDSLINLYSNADWLLFPSLHEGFGWPILEAQSLGCPVVTTDREPMKSVAADGGVLIDIGDLTQGAQIVANAAPERARISERGMVNASLYLPRNIYGRYIELYLDLYGARYNGRYNDAAN